MISPVDIKYFSTFYFWFTFALSLYLAPKIARKIG